MIKSSLSMHKVRKGRRNNVLSAHVANGQIRFNSAIVEHCQWNVDTRIYVEYDEETNALHCIQATNEDNVAGVYTLNSPVITSNIFGLYFSDISLLRYFGIADTKGTFCVKTDITNKHACYIMLNLPIVLRERKQR